MRKLSAYMKDVNQQDSIREIVDSHGSSDSDSAKENARKIQQNPMELRKLKQKFTKERLELIENYSKGMAK